MLRGSTSLVLFSKCLGFALTVLLQGKNSFLLGMFQPGDRKGWAVAAESTLAGTPSPVPMTAQSGGRAAVP